MRITNNSLSTNFLRNLSNNLSRMQKYQNQLSSGKEITKSSENPLLVSKILNLKANIGQNEMFNRNISEALGWVQTQDGALDGVTGSLQRIRELVIYGANGSLSKGDRIAIRDEVVQNVQGLKDIMNANFDGRYIFAGTNTDRAPFEIVETEEDTIDGKFTNYTLVYKGNTDNISRQISKGVETNLITDARDIVGSLNTVGPNLESDLGSLLADILNALKPSGNTEDLSGNLLGNLDKAIDRILGTRSKIGAIDNRLEASKSRNESENINLKSLLSEKEDVDIAKKYIEYSVMSTVYQASLAAGAKILQPSLLDYLR